MGLQNEIKTPIQGIKLVWRKIPALARGNENGTRKALCSPESSISRQAAPLLAASGFFQGFSMEIQCFWNFSSREGSNFFHPEFFPKFGCSTSAKGLVMSSMGIFWWHRMSKNSICAKGGIFSVSVWILLWENY